MIVDRFDAGSPVGARLLTQGWVSVKNGEDTRMGVEARWGETCRGRRAFLGKPPEESPFERLAAEINEAVERSIRVRSEAFPALEAIKTLLSLDGKPAKQIGYLLKMRDLVRSRPESVTAENQNELRAWKARLEEEGMSLQAAMLGEIITASEQPLSQEPERAG
jgi:hypothetical protein